MQKFFFRTSSALVLSVCRPVLTELNRHRIPLNPCYETIVTIVKITTISGIRVYQNLFVPSTLPNNQTFENYYFYYLNIKTLFRAVIMFPIVNEIPPTRLYYRISLKINRFQSEQRWICLSIVARLTARRVPQRLRWLKCSYIFQKLDLNFISKGDSGAVSNNVDGKYVFFFSLSALR